MVTTERFSFVRSLRSKSEGTELLSPGNISLSVSKLNFGSASSVQFPICKASGHKVSLRESWRNKLVDLLCSHVDNMTHFMTPRATLTNPVRESKLQLIMFLLHVNSLTDVHPDACRFTISYSLTPGYKSGVKFRWFVMPSMFICKKMFSHQISATSVTIPHNKCSSESNSRSAPSHPQTPVKGGEDQCLIRFHLQYDKTFHHSLSSETSEEAISFPLYLCDVFQQILSVFPRTDRLVATNVLKHGLRHSCRLVRQQIVQTVRHGQNSVKHLQRVRLHGEDETKTCHRFTCCY